MAISMVVLDTLQYLKKLKEAGCPEVLVEACAKIIQDKLATQMYLEKLRTDLELKLADLKADLIKWILKVSVAYAAVIIACIKFIS